MAEKIMRFDNMEGDILCVTFRGANVQAGEILAAAQPVVIQMDGGGGEYAAVKYATASVSMLTTGVQHLDLYAAAPLAVAVDIVNETTGEVLFAGYVTPNTFGQPIDGVNETLTIECVDYLGIAKFVPMAVPLGAVMTLEEVFAHAAAKLGASSWQLSKTLHLKSGDSAVETGEYQKLTVAGRCFYNDTTPSPIGTESVSNIPESLTVYDALEMIAESLRMTWVQNDSELLLFDDVAARGGLNPFGRYITLTEESFAETGSQISVLPRYSMVSLARRSDKEVAAMQPILDDALLFSGGAQREYSDNVGSDSETLTISQGLGSFVADCVAPYGELLSYVELSPPKLPAYSNAWKIAAWRDEHSWQNCVRIKAHDEDGVARTAVRLHSDYCLSFPERSALGFRMRITAGFSNDRERIYPYKLRASSIFFLYASLSMTRGNTTKYYNSVTEQWVDYSFVMPLRFAEQAEWRSVFSASSAAISDPPFATVYPPDEVFASGMPGGTLSLTLYAPPESSVEWKTCYIKEIDIKAVVLPDRRAANAKDKPAEVEYLGTYDYMNTADTVELPIDVRSPLSAKMFGTVIDGVDLLTTRQEGASIEGSKRWEVGVEYDDGSGGRLSMIQRIERQRNPGDGMEYAITLVDAHNAGVSPMTAISCRAWTGRKVVAAYTRDLAESKINVTLN